MQKELMGCLSLKYQDKTFSAFGSAMESLTFSSIAYRYGFNGMEEEDDLNGAGNAYDFGERIYDGRLGRWLSLDPLTRHLPNLSPYNFVSNSPLIFIDPDGKFQYPAGKKEQYENDYPVLTHILKNLNNILNDPDAVSRLIQLGWYEDEAEIKSVTNYDDGPTIHIARSVNNYPYERGFAGATDFKQGSQEVFVVLNPRIVNRVENLYEKLQNDKLSDKRRKRIKKRFKKRVISLARTVIEETAEVGVLRHKLNEYNKDKSTWLKPAEGRGGEKGDLGNKVESPISEDTIISNLKLDTLVKKEDSVVLEENTKDN